MKSLTASCTFKVAFLSVVLLGLSSCLLSCLSLNDKLDFAKVPADVRTVEHYLDSQEAQVSNMVPQTNKRIVWAGHPGKQTPYSLVYLPGYSATRQEIAPVPERVAKTLHMNLFETRFKGNGICGGGDSYKGITVQDHLRDAYEALNVGELIGEKVILVGTSTGAPFGIWLAHRFPDKVAALVFVSPNNQPADSRSNLMLGPFGKTLAYAVTRGYVRADSYSGGPLCRAHELEYLSQVQHVDGTLAMMGIVGIARKVKPELLAVPYLMIYSEGDKVVSTKAFKKFFARYAQKTKAPKVSVEVIGAHGEGQHGMIGDLVDERTTKPAVDVIVQFLKENLGKPLPGKEDLQVVLHKEIRV